MPCRAKAFVRPALGAILALALATAAQAGEVRRRLKLRDVDAAEVQRGEAALMAAERRMEAIRRLRGVTLSNVPEERRPEMILRLAELYLAQGRWLYLEEAADFEERYQRCAASMDCRVDAVVVDNSGSRDWNARAVAQYRAILTGYPRYERVDQATYDLAVALQDLGRTEEATAALERVVKLHPGSDFAADAYLRLGENRFDAGDAAGALRAYQRAASFPEYPKRAFALYKLGWSAYNLGQWDPAIAALKQVVDLGAAPVGGIQLREEALRDLVRFFVDGGRMEEGYAYFVAVGRPEWIGPALERLARASFDAGAFDEADRTWRRLILREPRSPENAGRALELLEIARIRGDREARLETALQIARDYGSDSAWAAAQDPEAARAADARIEASLRRVAVDLHTEARQLERARRTEAPAVYGLARRAYDAWLERYAGSAHEADVRYAAGELLYKLRDFPGAYAHYRAVVALDPGGSHAEACAESAIQAAREAARAEGVAASVAGVEQPLSEWDRAVVDACDQLVQLYPRHAKAEAAAYEAAHLLYERGHYEEAGVRFRAVIDANPASPRAEQAAHLILDSLAIRENWDALVENARFYADRPGLGGPGFAADVAEVLQRASFKQIEARLARDGDARAAADAFAAIALQFPQASTAALALNNATVHYRAAGDLDGALRVGHVLIDDPRFGPATRFYAEQVAALAYDHESVAEFGPAAALYERRWALAGGAPTELDGAAIFSAAVFREAVGDGARAIEDYQAFARAFPDDPRTTEVALRVAAIRLEDGDSEGALAAYRAVFEGREASVEERLHAALRRGEILRGLGREAERQALYRTAIDQVRSAPTPAVAALQAELMMARIEPELEAYRALRIASVDPSHGPRAEDRAIAASLGAKGRALLQIEARLAEVVDTGAGAWGVAALVELGRAYEAMATALREGDRPSYLSPSQAQTYEVALEDRAFVQEEKAITAYALALEKSHELSLYGEPPAFAARRLGELRPELYPGIHERLREPRYLAAAEVRFDYESADR